MLGGTRSAQQERGMPARRPRGPHSLRPGQGRRQEEKQGGGRGSLAWIEGFRGPHHRGHPI